MITIPQFAQRLADIKDIAKNHPGPATRAANAFLVEIGREDATKHCDCCSPLDKFIQILTQELEKRRLDDSTDKEIYDSILEIPSCNHELIYRMCKYLLARFGIHMDWQSTNDAMIDRIKREMTKPMNPKDEIAKDATRMRELWVSGRMDAAVSLAKKIIASSGYRIMTNDESSAEFIVYASVFADRYCNESA